MLGKVTKTRWYRVFSPKKFARVRTYLSMYAGFFMAKTMSKKFINILSNTELLQTRQSIEEWLEWAEKHSHQNIFFGAGVMTSKAISVAVPFDILAMFFLAELLRRVVDGEKVVVLVADQHAITNESFSLEKVKKITDLTLNRLQMIKKSFDLKHFEIIKTTPLNFDENIKKIFRSLPDIPNQYLKHEIADTIWLQKHHGVGIKLGWAMSQEASVQGHDERFFDTAIAQFVPDVAFIHAKPGRTADKLRQRVSPYVSIAGEDRLLLSQDENVVEKIQRWRSAKDNPAVKPLIRHLSQIIRLHDGLFEPLRQMTFEEKIRTLVDQSVENK